MAVANVAWTLGKARIPGSSPDMTLEKLRLPTRGGRDVHCPDQSRNPCRTSLPESKPSTAGSCPRDRVRCGSQAFPFRLSPGGVVGSTNDEAAETSNCRGWTYRGLILRITSATLFS